MSMTFATSPADVVTDTAGNVLPGRELRIYTARNGVQITALFDLDGNPLPQLITDVLGRYPFRLGTDEYKKVWALDPADNWWVLVANEAYDLIGQTTSVSPLPPFDDMDHTHAYVSAHRGGKYIHPEGTRLGRLNAAGLGIKVIDGGDVRVTLDGVLYDCHNTTLDYATNLTGPIASTPSAKLMGQGVMDCSNWFGGGWPDQPITSIVDTLDDLGGKTYLTFEIKPGVPANSVQKMIDMVVARGLKDQILIAAGLEELLAPAIAAGMSVMLLGNDMIDVAADTDLINRGVLYTGGHVAMTASTAKQLMDNGHRVVTWGTDRHNLVDKYRAGASGELWGYISDDPFYVKGHVEGTYEHRLTSDPFDSLTYYHGHQADDLNVEPTSRGTFQADAGGAFFCVPVALQRRAVLQGWGCPLQSPAAYSISYEQDWLADLGSSGGGVVFGCPNDDPYRGDDQSPGLGVGTQPGYELLTFSSGLTRLFRRDPNALPVALGDFTGPKNPLGTPVGIKVTVAGNDITFERTDVVGYTVTVTDTTYRGAYFHLAASDNGAEAGVRWRNVVIA